MELHHPFVAEFPAHRETIRSLKLADARVRIGGALSAACDRRCHRRSVSPGLPESFLLSQSVASGGDWRTSVHSRASRIGDWPKVCLSRKPNSP